MTRMSFAQWFRCKMYICRGHKKAMSQPRLFAFTFSVQFCASLSQGVVLSILERGLCYKLDFFTIWKLRSSVRFQQDTYLLMMKFCARIENWVSFCRWSSRAFIGSSNRKLILGLVTYQSINVTVWTLYVLSIFPIRNNDVTFTLQAFCQFRSVSQSRFHRHLFSVQKMFRLSVVPFVSFSIRHLE